ncbi:50S ribosomal protein L23 [Salsipaludibacter albus]|uniref:50S ribosomal protein L23 n=1 Tax=Salsipaludibacter albus TaxID=2849650 RepID=UPI001EE3F9F3|nr:50S ribosomal protein L23 [Salsipaludibacter albus]MBY5161564.1 50S ribosomal protein L23 [Salsipaludibacter albus]
MEFKDPRHIIKRPVISEKSYGALDEDKYTFIVDKRATKTQIKAAVEEVFDVKVVKINTQNRVGKVKRRGWVEGRRPNVKRAIVTVAEGDEIELFDVAL